MNDLSPTEQVAFKNMLKQFCQSVIEERIAAAKTTIQQAQDAANNEEKSSAGDKYETGRAMGHLQKDMHARQLTEYIKELAELHYINAGKVYEMVNAGAFIETADAIFFIAAGLGKQTVNGKPVYFLSPAAPLAMVMNGKSKGDVFVFNGRQLTIKELY